MTAIPSKEVTTVQVAGVGFAFFSDEEVRKLSVKQIVSPIVFDNLKNAVPGGLCDAALGPMEPHGTCATCGLRYQYCPGHFGHIELSVPVYNPLVFTTLYKLLRCTCLHCFRLKMREEEVERYRARLALLAAGRLVEAMQLTLGASSAVAKAAKDINAADVEGVLPSAGGKGSAMEEADAMAKQETQHAPAAAGVRDGLETVHTVEAMRQCILDLLSRIPVTKCDNCGALNPSIRREGAAKIFQMPLQAAQIAKNQMAGTPIMSALTTRSAPRDKATEEVERQMAAHVASHGRKRRRVGGALDGSFAGGQDQAEEGGEEEDEDNEETARGSQAAGGKAAGAEAAGRPRYITPTEVMEIMRRMWAVNGDILSYIFSSPKANRGRPQNAPAHRDTYKMFFLQTVAVAPNKFRPASRVGDQVFEHAQNTLLTQIINTNLDLVSVNALAEEGARAPGADLGRSLRLWLELQSSVNALFDSAASDKGVMGIKQQLEKKEGLFRKNMMGKRVNFACRSVISPDPYIGTGEIGVPPYFAKKLSFPERVTPWNVEQLRAAVRTGSEALPGAVAVEDELGRIVSLHNMAPERRDALAKTLLSKSSTTSPGAGPGGKAGRPHTFAGNRKIVYRHLQDGDLMLTNRQPTLHKPGMMAHRARVLKGERTIRMHYANCATFNADFDGDEINLHFPQDHLGRAEGYGIVHSDHQYIVPTDGKPIRGLIQDHVVAGVLLTERDSFLTRPEFMQLVYNAIAPGRPGIKDSADVPLPAPAILKPQPLWTGKQVMTAVVAHFTRGMPPVTLRCKGKLAADAWGADSGEAEVEFRQGVMVAGCMDKAQFGKFGLVHGLQELYGNAVAGTVLSAFSRLFTFYLQVKGFTCGIDDVLLVGHAERARAARIADAETVATLASAGLTSLSLSDAGEAQEVGGALRAELARRYRSDATAGVAHDMKVTSVLNPLSSEVVKVCLPGGQQKPFPWNCMAMMTSTGAKGSQVNFSQISCLLGQQELEGRRVPRMASGKTLPCFAPFDAGARSGGFVSDRFLSGLRPQEYYFHCMAGREGLVDTTVKTSRSGYLQRCIVKNLEALRVHYDCTVRDDTDGSLVQFYYGEDGVDVLQTSYLRQFGFLAENAPRFAQQLDLHHAVAASETMGIARQEAAAQKAVRLRQKQLRRKAKGRAGADPDAQLPLTTTYRPTHLGVTSEAFSDALADYIRRNPDRLLKQDDAKPSKAERGRAMANPLSAQGFQRLLELKFMRSLAAPGEAVGVLAAQSIGEPSTQMTLNTFHMAGRGEANVTLGIPRLRELFMTAAQSIKTPVMTLPIRTDVAGGPLKAARTVANRLRRLRLAEVLEGLTVEESVAASTVTTTFGRGRVYRICMQFMPESEYPPEANLSFAQVAEAFRDEFFHRLQAAVRAELKRCKAASNITNVSLAKLAGEEGAAAPGPAPRDEGEPDRKKKSEKEDEDENAEENEEYREGKLQWQGGHGEAATYEGGDEEDKAIAAAARRASERQDLVASGDESDDKEEDAKPAVSTSGRAGVTPKKRKEGGAEVEAAADVEEEAGRCEAVVTLPLDYPKLLMMELVQRVAAATMIRATPGIERCRVVEPEKRDAQPYCEAEGINFAGVWEHADLVATAAVTTNDVGAVLRTFGVEAARATIVHEVIKVFEVYGIGVDVRHLALIADFMTHQGGYRALNRMGIDSSASPFLKISFETAAHFLTDATMRGATDELTSPASRLVVGRVVEAGTGCMELRTILA